MYVIIPIILPMSFSCYSQVSEKDLLISWSYQVGWQDVEALVDNTPVEFPLVNVPLTIITPAIYTPLISTLLLSTRVSLSIKVRLPSLFSWGICMR